ncbi:MAG: element excision factor XisH family protein, partial [Nostocales cyanobacterium 94392]|nr:element excision factor XisH family protein [Nostocales cyanobacterium 94392]
LWGQVEAFGISRCLIFPSNYRPNASPLQYIKNQYILFWRGLLYLAVPVDVYETFFQSRLARIAVQRHQVKIVVYDPIMEVIVKWQL